MASRMRGTVFVVVKRCDTSPSSDRDTNMCDLAMPYGGVECPPEPCDVGGWEAGRLDPLQPTSVRESKART
jgi:hypothetical protein